ncbi:MAG: hypothetical protein Q9M50_04315 [Methylococcales bacterium]|nr:hypothetical protein [Methylococcales bacterium]
MTTFKVKDYVKTAENLYFAVIKEGVEKGRVLVCLRYIFQSGCWEKFETATATLFLQQNYPDYLYYSPSIDVEVHALPVEAIVKHYQPHDCLQTLLQQPTENAVINDLIAVCTIFSDNGLDITQLGITGSLLIGAQKSTSDIDLVFHDRAIFHQARQLARQLIARNQLQPLTQADWQHAFIRRGCELSFNEYLWHEKRKYNKVLIHNRKVDISLSQPAIHDPRTYSKQGPIVLTVKITEDSHGFDYPIRYSIDHLEISTIICFTATYSGQAKAGEWVEVSGQLEKSETGYQQIVVGSDREAKGDFIRVINSPS